MSVTKTPVPPSNISLAQCDLAIFFKHLPEGLLRSSACLITITDDKPTKLSQSKHVLYYYIRLTIVRKIDAGDGSYPSVNTCVHYLKVSCNDILKKCKTFQACTLLFNQRSTLN